MFLDRLEDYKKLEEKTQSKLLVYITSDRPGLETQLQSDILDKVTNHLDKIGDVNKISLFLYTLGGSTLAAWSLVNLIRNFCKEFDIIIPFNCRSAGTLMCLGANKIIMTKQATLGPIDPSVNGYMNPEKQINNQIRTIPVNVEFVNGYIALANELGIKDEEYITEIYSQLTEKLHPLTLGEVYRSKSQIKMLARRLLKHQKIDEKKIEKIINFLCSESGSHDYTIYRNEAKEELELNIEKPDEELYSVIKNLYDNIALELELSKLYDPKLYLGNAANMRYSFRRALIESVEGHTDVYLSEGELKKQTINNPGLPIPQNIIQDNREFEGWKHEPYIENQN